jgi:DNA repair protein RadC
MSLKNIHKIEQPREKLEKYGPSKLSDVELFAILLRTGLQGTPVLDLSKKILRHFPDSRLAYVEIDELKKIHGLGQAKACEIVACFELGKRLLKEKKAALILSPREVWEELKDIRSHKKEHFVVFFLDTQNQVVKREVVSIGTLNSSLIHPREVFEPAIKYLAAHIIIAHNHPSGSLEPSDEDITVTRRLAEAGKLLGIEILDHVIATANGYTSFKEKNLL